MMISKYLIHICKALLVLFVFASPVHADLKADCVTRIERSRTYLEEIMRAPDLSIPQNIFKDCKGIMIMRQYKAGFIFGAKGGYGIAMVRNKKGNWSPPSFIKSGEGSFGFQIGGQSVDSIFLIMNDKGMEMLKKSKFKIGGDASAAVGPVGRDLEAKVGVEMSILAYSRAKGLYVGATIEGGLLVNDDEANATFYNKKGLTSKNILFENKVSMPKEAKKLLAALKDYAAGHYPASTSQTKSEKEVIKIHCSKCRALADEDAKFCSRCGTRL